MGPLLIPCYFDAYTSNVREAAMVFDEIRRDKCAKVDGGSIILMVEDKAFIKTPTR
jgi:hypothetical protein